MGIWSRLFRHDEVAAEPSAGDGAASAEPTGHEPETAAPPQAAPAPEWLGRLERLGQPGGADVDEAVALLRQTHGSSEQILALQTALRVLGEGVTHEPLRVACAAVLVDRGQSERALELVRDCRSIGAMMLAADLYAARGDLARALSTVERVLARAIDTPGARERHDQWSTQLGRTPLRERRPVDAGATVIAPTGPKVPFRLLREVARGGAGTVYEAEDAELGRRLAYKIYHRAAADREQIERESRTAARLEGAGVVRIYDADPGAGWLAMEWLGRGTLRDALAGDRLGELLPLERWARPLLLALGRVHAAGLVHADLKPANVFFRAPDEPVLGDFGISRARGDRNLGGTPGYLSPERLGGAPADARDDVYAVGRIIEDVLGALEQAMAAGKLAPPPDAAALARYAALARACLADAARRPADAAAVLTALPDG
jgi:eukaryotic-like serine/threonine-protein kinase